MHDTTSLQINLQRAGRLLGITTKGLSVGPSELYVTRFRILHSMDGKIFTPYSDANVTDKVRCCNLPFL